ncbi:hypothetical protein HDU76_001268 [Blyttiomyces sp. JEL0837]|nr:hypothetical protein HDU76_001268 [Blyttiomyces sp. JEL0837]
MLQGVAGVGAAVDKYGWLKVAVESGHADVVKVLLNLGGVNPAENDNAVSKSAIELGCRDVVKVLLENKNIVAGMEGNEALLLACRYGRLEVLKSLLEIDGIDVAAPNTLAVAAENGHISVVEFLLTLKEVDPSDRHNHALKMALKNGHAEVVRLLEAAGFKTTFDIKFKMSSASRPRSRSLWDLLPPETKHQILCRTDLLTRCLHGLLTPQDIEIYAIEIWKLAFIHHYPGELAILPQNILPTLFNGLRLVTTTDMYHRLCRLRPDLASLDKVKWYTRNSFWTWIKSDAADVSETLFKQCVAETFGLESLLVHIAMQHDWVNELEGFMGLVTTLTDIVKLVVVAARYGHGRLMIRLFDDLRELSVEARSKLLPLDQLYSYILRVTAIGGNLEAFQHVMIHAAAGDPYYDCNPAFQMACKHGHLNIIRLLLRAYHSTVDPTADENMAIRLAAEGGHVDVVKLLLELEGVDPTDDDNDALCKACARGHVDVVDVLTAVDGLDVTVPNNNAVQLAVANNRRDVVVMLCQDGTGTDIETLSELHEEAAMWAAQRGYVDILDAVLKRGFFETFDLWYEIITLAAEHGQADVIRFALAVEGLMEDINYDDLNLAIQIASQKGHAEVVKVLLGVEGLSAGPITDKALEVALVNGYEEIVKLLLDWRSLKGKADV